MKTYLPGAQIILSTADEVEGLGFEGVELVPGASVDQFMDINCNINNVDKLISTTAIGVSIAQREFCLKLRTDHPLCGDDLLRHIGGQPGGLFSSRIGVSNLFLRNPLKLPYLFHLADTVQFGRTEDLRRLWGVGTWYFVTVNFCLKQCCLLVSVTLAGFGGIQ